ncbi:hypothetical protein KAFR_0B03300 [Kazachstania africana CBS 2517]|uniref:Nodulin-like domain-containing protein n=1 Tax=Kazachstania africana (strain ATCC 22294 / BCRC 22015 / CBS 2517 / CECT 1963 / NBRC 1671 / NRRL Y-8276) TaxID=1071382 RepID=H2AQH7_KAZAF|nr:hypothetical protein KAFR_0B03300 [Kazachstania africana CBS 2517]CCF56627.1 hypothetical protein KAFR_0B03300 [Kazachstania africana CBS 2517]
MLRVIQIFCATLWCLCSAGIIFGFAAFKVVLIEEGVYSEYCSASQNNSFQEPCIEQDLRLNFMFAVSAGITNVMAFPVGYILDNYGPRVCGIIGSLFLTLASSMFIWASSLPLFFDPYLAGYILLAIGGPFVFISSFQLANSFPTKSGSILALLTGAFDSSSALFVLYRICYQKGSLNLSLHNFFSLYLLVPTFILLCQLTIMPHSSYKTRANMAKLSIEGLNENGELARENDATSISEENETQALLPQETGDEFIQHSSSENHLHRRKSVLEVYIEGQLEEKSGGVFGILHNLEAKDQIKSPWFYLMLVFSVISMLRINYFIATIRSQEEYLLGNIDLALEMNHIFDILLPLGGVISIPFIGMILDKMKTFNVLVLMSVTSVIISLLGLIPNSFSLNLMGILLLVVYRPFYYTVVSDYSSKIFGFDTFGTVYGLLICICGFCNFGQNWLDKCTHIVFNMNPIPVNLLLLFASILSACILLKYIHVQLMRKQGPQQFCENY